MRKEAKVAFGIVLTAGAAWGLSALAQYRGSYEYPASHSQKYESLGGYGYTITLSRFRPDLVTLEGRSALFPPVGIDGSLQRGRERLTRDCGGIIDEQALSISKVKVVQIVVVDRNKSTCFPSQI